ncbi:hypothetical protein AKO1_002653 [Acrasis kona]|uniref:Uncharacterized protein n=1 Tax=Acrasis kona TaxID=1008807 RepID=A0AAW2YZP1_9EUKA
MIELLKPLKIVILTITDPDSSYKLSVSPVITSIIVEEMQSNNVIHKVLHADHNADLGYG